MSEENVIEFPEQKSSSILGFLTQEEFPEEVVTLYWNRDIAKQIRELEDKIMVTYDASQDELVAKQEALIKEAQDSAIKVTIKGTPPRIGTDIAKLVLAEAKSAGLEKNSEGWNEYVIERAGKLNTVSHIVKIEANGETSSPASEEDVQIMFDNLPEVESNKLIMAIASLEDAVNIYQSELLNETF